MRRFWVSLGSFITLTGLCIVVGCDWTSGGGVDDFNTSQGAGVTINWTGVYFGQIGGRAVAQTSLGTITQFTLTQSGDTVEVTDDQGSRYVGRVGSPGQVASPSDGVFPSGSMLVEAQVSWEGKDEIAQRDVSFVGVIHAVSVTDIRGSATTETTSEENTSGSTTNVTVTIDDTTVITTTNVIPAPSITESATTTATTQFSLSEANTQFRLQGTWTEAGGVVSSVDALSPGGAGTIITTE